MFFIEYTKLTGRNFLSIGNAVFEYDFKKGLVGLIGENGSGKSTILDLIHFVLYGTTLRQASKKNIVNKINKKECEATLNFSVYRKTDESMQLIDKVKVRRGIKPDILEFSVFNDSKNEYVDIPQLSTIKLYQDLLTKTYHRISTDLFKSVTILTTSKNHKNFIDLEASRRREVVSEIFGTHQVDEMLKLAKDKLSEIKSDKRLAIASLDQSRSALSSLNDLKVQIEVSASGDLSAKKAEIKASLEKLIEDKRVATAFIESLDKKESEINEKITGLNDKKKDHDISKLSYWQGKKEDLESEVEKLRDIDTCPFCGQDVNDLTIQKQLAVYHDRIADIDDKLSGIISDLRIIQDLDSKIANLKYTIQQIELKRAEKNKVIAVINADISRLKNEAMSLVNNTKPTDSIDSVNAQIERCGLDVEGYEDRVKDLDKLEIAFNDFIIKQVLSDSGTKADFIQEYIPVLNEKINEYSRRLNNPFYFEFDPTFDFKIESLLNTDPDFEYSLLSEGQKKKLDIAISFSFIDIVKTMSGWDCNLLALDEVLDNGLDQKTLGLVIEDLKNFSMTSMADKNIILITHKMSDTTIFENSIEFELVDGITEWKWV